VYESTYSNSTWIFGISLSGSIGKTVYKKRIPYQREKLLHVYFDGEKLIKHFKAGFLCFDAIIIELKASTFTHNHNLDQSLNYLKLIKFQLGIIVNFGQKSLVYKQILNSFLT